MDSGGANPSITIFYGASDGNFTESAWDSNVTIAGTHAAGNVTYSLTGLGTSTQYTYRAKGTNSGGSAWSEAYTFTTAATLQPPAVAAAPATSLATTSVTMNGNVLAYDGNSQPTITNAPLRHK